MGTETNTSTTDTALRQRVAAAWEDTTVSKSLFAHQLRNELKAVGRYNDPGTYPANKPLREAIKQAYRAHDGPREYFISDLRTLARAYEADGAAALPSPDET